MLLLCVACFANAQAPVPDSPAIEAQAHAMLAKLTLAQKIELLGGKDWMDTHAEPSIGLPPLKMSDGPVGIRTWGPDTAYVDGNALAASWDLGLATKVGESLAHDARARNVNFLLGPGVNIIRSPLSGRNFEYPSEDPFLNSKLGVAYIQGVQSQGVVATVKHFAANNQEYNRHNASSDVDERTLREIYLPAFEAAVKDGHVDAVMDSYNLLNGVHTTQSKFLNLDILKGEWGFQGILMSDWFAVYDAVAVANNGLDLEMPGPPAYMNPKGLMPAIQAGTLKESTIDDKVLRLLRVALRYGFLDHPQFNPSYSTYSVEDRAVALQEAREGITLLKNDQNFLPLNTDKVKTIAIIGPDAYPAITGGGGSSQVTAFEPISLLAGIANVAGPNVHVLYTRGLPQEKDVFDYTAWAGDVKVETFDNPDFSGSPVVTSKNNVSDWGGPVPWKVDDPHPKSMRYTANFKAPKAGKYLLLAAAGGEDAFKLTVAGKQMMDVPHAEGQIPQAKTLDLAAGQTLQIVVNYVPHAPGVRLGLGLVNEADLILPEVKQFASAADVVIVAAGYNSDSEGEGEDRTFELPWGQEALIQAVAAANPHTVVTLTGGIGVATLPWIGKIPALLETFYLGQEGGTAVGEILFGKQNPEGKLPATFDRTWKENPSSNWYYPSSETKLHVKQPGVAPVDLLIPHVKYGDKLMVGYRYWTTTGKHPLYPFGYGLSYTTFQFQNLNVPAQAASGSTISVSFDVKNTGKLAGAEVAELYVSDPSAKATRPERELKGFQKVRLASGETKHVTLTLNARAFSYWSVKAHKWIIDPGKFVIRVGDSSENTPLSANLMLHKIKSRHKRRYHLFR